MKTFKALALITLLPVSLVSPIANAATETPAIFLLQNLEDSMNRTEQLARVGVDLAINSRKAAGIQDRAKIELIDLESNISEASNHLSSEIRKRRPVAMIGVIRSDLALAVSDIAEKEGIVFMTPLATHPKVTEGKRYTLRTCLDDRQQAGMLAKFMLEVRKRKNGAVLYNRNQSFGIGFQEEFVKAMESFHGQKPLLIPFETDADLGQDVLKRLIEAKPDYIVIPSYQVEAAAVLSKLVNVLPATTEYFGPDSWGGGKLFHRVFAGPQVKFRGFYAEHWAKESKTVENREFLELYKQYPPKNKALLATESSDLAPTVAYYELASFILNAFRNLKGSESLLSAIKRTNYSGPRGRLDFSKGNTPSKPIYMFEISPFFEKYLMRFDATGAQ